MIKNSTTEIHRDKLNFFAMSFLCFSVFSVVKNFKVRYG